MNREGAVRPRYVASGAQGRAPGKFGYGESTGRREPNGPSPGKFLRLAPYALRLPVGSSGIEWRPSAGTTVKHNVPTTPFLSEET